jgi:hypothetical protein
MPQAAETPGSPPATMLEWAQKHAADGFRVLPLIENGKIPDLEDWPNRATRNPDKIRKWWAPNADGTPSRRNIGLAMGGEFFAVDPDVSEKKGNGPAQYDALRFQWDFWTPTRRHRTPGGGFHFIYRKPADILVKTGSSVLDKAVDTRGEGGQVVAPGSMIDGVPYVIIDDMPPAEACPELLEAARKTPTPEKMPDLELAGMNLGFAVVKGIEILTALGPAIQGQRGHDHMVRAVRALRDEGIPFDSAFPVLMKWNESNVPPFGISELKYQAESAWKSAKGQMGAASVAAFEPIPETPDAPEKLELPQLNVGTDSGLIFYGAPYDIESEPDPIVDGLIPAGSVGFIYGPSWHGKSMIAALMAHCVATGSPFGDRDVTQGGVLIVATEGHAGTGKRAEALLRTRGAPNAPIAFWKAFINLGDGERGAKQILARCLAFKKRFGFLPRLLIIDTLAAGTLHVDEKDNTDMGAIIVLMKRLRAALGDEASVALVHHPGKDDKKGLRGAYALVANTEFTVHVASGTISVEKNREDEKQDDMHFVVEKVFLGIKKNGKAVTSAVARIADAGKSKLIASEKDLNDRQRVLLKLLRQNYAAPPSGSDVFGVSFEDVLAAAVREGLTRASTEKTRKESISNMLDAIRHAGLAEVQNDQWRPVTLS